ncbi:hypothetical protein JOL79_11070 [Microbispora sp. RL4-1S]|uniref:Uncharacterized protein n=1 Tax=Microbispora oryzae TaxID=2806554 RepID=A0A941AJM4_9ACTN|nr:hypothetical protein [Microbispora oryzae]MBP2704353.1 hypothetical protein [Microbispora oryzae]
MVASPPDTAIDRLLQEAQRECPGWRLWRSDVGRFWATREQRFPPAAEAAGAERTVDADTLDELAQVVAEQDAQAARASPPHAPGDQPAPAHAALPRGDGTAGALTGVVITRQTRQLAALEQTYPAWQIRETGGQVRWWATRRRPPTLAEIAAGVVTTLARSTPEQLADAMAAQDEIAHRVR